MKISFSESQLLWCSYCAISSFYTVFCTFFRLFAFVRLLCTWQRSKFFFVSMTLLVLIVPQYISSLLQHCKYAFREFFPLFPRIVMFLPDKAMSALQLMSFKQLSEKLTLMFNQISELLTWKDIYNPLQKLHRYKIRRF